jgi:hypothetical protein
MAPEFVEMWDAINAYAESCGGDTSEKTVSDRRMNAVVAVDRAIEAWFHAKQRIILQEEQ